MSCCGKKREEIRQRRTVFVASPSATLSAHPQTPVVFKGSGDYLVTGEHSRHVYHFSPEPLEQWIDPRDLAALLRTGLFQPKS